MSGIAIVFQSLNLDKQMLVVKGGKNSLKDDRQCPNISILAIDFFVTKGNQIRKNVIHEQENLIINRTAFARLKLISFSQH